MRKNRKYEDYLNALSVDRDRLTGAKMQLNYAKALIDSMTMDGGDKLESFYRGWAQRELVCAMKSLETLFDYNLQRARAAKKVKDDRIEAGMRGTFMSLTVPEIPF